MERFEVGQEIDTIGFKRVGRYSVRRLATKALTVEWAARIHQVPLDEFLDILNTAVAKDQATESA